MTLIGSTLQDDLLANRLVDLVLAMDIALTGKFENRRHDNDLDHAKAMLEELSPWEVYLSDGGYSRVGLDIESDVPIRITYGQSRPEVIAQFEELMKEESCQCVES